VGGPTPYGPRSALFSDQRRREVQPLIDLLQAIGKERQKTPAQVCVCARGVQARSRIIALMSVISLIWQERE